MDKISIALSNMFASTARSKDSVFRAFLLGSILHDAFLCGIAQEASRKCQVLSTMGTIGRFEGTFIQSPHHDTFAMPHLRVQFEPTCAPLGQRFQSKQDP